MAWWNVDIAHAWSSKEAHCGSLVWARRGEARHFGIGQIASPIPFTHESFHWELSATAATYIHIAEKYADAEHRGLKEHRVATSSSN